MKLKIPQLTHLVVLIGTIFGGATAAQHWLGLHQSTADLISEIIASVLTIGQAFAPSIIKSAEAEANPGPSIQTKGTILLLALLLIPAALKAQTIPEAPATHPQNLYAGGASYSVGASPAIAGTGLYAHNIGPADADPGLYAFTIVDALPNTVKPFTVSTNIGAGIAQELFTLGKIPVYAPTAAGISWNGNGNTGWQWNGGVIASIHVKGDYYILPSVRFLKSSVSGGTGYQPIIGVLFGWGK